MQELVKRRDPSRLLGMTFTLNESAPSVSLARPVGHPHVYQEMKSN